MNWDQIEGDWQRFKHAAKQRWDRLGEQQLDAIKGRRSLLAARVKEAYSLSDEDAERELAWQARLAQ